MVFRFDFLGRPACAPAPRCDFQRPGRRAGDRYAVAGKGYENRVAVYEVEIVKDVFCETFKKEFYGINDADGVAFDMDTGNLTYTLNGGVFVIEGERGAVRKAVDRPNVIPTVIASIVCEYVSAY